MLNKLRAELEKIRNQKHKHFEDFDHLIQKIANSYAYLFPKFTRDPKGSHYVYHFHIPGSFPFTVVKEHGSREYQSPKAAKRVINNISDILDYIEAKEPDGEGIPKRG